MSEPVKIICADEYVLDGLLYPSASDANAFIVFQGGTAVKKEFYSNFCEWLSNQGYHVLLYDYRGVGGSRYGSLRGMNASLLDWAQLDMAAAFQFAEEKFPSLKKILVGHSIGTQLAGFIPNNHLLKGIVGINSSTGTWWKMLAPRKYGAFLLWYVVNPSLTPVFGYAPLKRLGLMEDLPRQVINQWSHWCRSQFYFGDHLGKSIPSQYFRVPNIPFTIHYFNDDYIATRKTVADLLALYKGTESKMIEHSPSDYGARFIGHFGIFSRKYKESFWKKIAEEVEAIVKLQA